MGSLKLYYDFMSQPSRALYITLKHHKIPFEPILTNIGKGQNKTEDFKKISKFQKLPAIDDNGFNMIESIAILRYVSRTKDLPKSFYSDDVKKQARIDEFLEWQHSNIRYFLSMYFVHKWLMPVVKKQPVKPERLASIETQMIDSIDNFEKLWLTPGPFITGDQITAADVWAACEIEQPRIGGYNPREGRSILTAWIDRVRENFNPVYDKAHSAVYALEKMSKKN